MPRRSKRRGSSTGRSSIERANERVAIHRARIREEEASSQEEADIIPPRQLRPRNRRVSIEGRSDREQNTQHVARRRAQQQQESESSQEETNQPNQQNVNRPLLDYTNSEGQKVKRAAIKFDNILKAIQFNQCANCLRKFPDLKLNPNGLCSVCKADPTKLVSPNLVIEPVPPELQDLTLIEQMLIAQVHPVVQFYRIKNAQTGYRGNVISFVQNISQCYSELPLLPADVAKIIMFTKDTPTGQVQFKARREKIVTALVWLKAHNVYYQHITINFENVVSIPDDGDMVPVMREFAIDVPESAEESAASKGPPSAAESLGEHEAEDIIRDETFVPLLLPVDQQEKIHEQLTMPYPEMSRKPVDEFATEGYIAKAFPCLFPSGKGDFLFPRTTRITQKEYIEYLLQYEDRRFIKDKRFCYFAMNTLLRHQALSCSGIAVKRSALEGQTVASIRERMKDNPGFLRKVMAYASKLRSTQQYWAQRCGELLDFVNQIGCPSIFFTLSAADYHWPDLFRLLLEDDSRDPDELTEKERRDLMHDNPDIVAFFLQKRCQLFRDEILKPIFGVVDFWNRLVCAIQLMKLYD